MASGVRLGGRLCFRVCMTANCHTRYRTLTSNLSSYLWRYRLSSGINTVSQKRYFANDKGSSFLDALPLARMDNSSMVTETEADATASTDAASSTPPDGQDDDDPLMQQMAAKYERYRQWLAKIMGKDPETFSDKEIKEAVEYLMPSGLYAKDARPQFKDPEELYQRRAQIVDKQGRPLHAAFFTGQIGFHDLLFEIYEQNAKLNASEETKLNAVAGLEASDGELSETSDDGYSSDTSSDSSDEDKLDDSSAEKEAQSSKPSRQPRMRWIGKPELERKINEKLTDKEYDVVLHRLKKLASHPNAELATPFLLRFLEVIPIQGMRAVEKTLNEKGEAVGIGHRKRAIAEVMVTKGSGNVTINNAPLTQYFVKVEDRKQVMYPFLTVDAVGEYDVECGVIGGGTTGQAGAIRLAISRALLNFEDSYLEPLQQAGLLIRDPRIKERKKPGQKRARKKFAW
ncbi:unnamed protein product [Porites lobata]|uniref:Ribosomal protein S9 n=1 Tax=Porites lobata TaxID=104759 RepID=A0ABN8RJU8_9CNID|nr:unnamed protein product [Porites lobata]